MTSYDTTRRLAAILMADVVGHSALMQLHEATTLFSDMEITWWTDQAERLRGRIESGQDFVWFIPFVDGPPS